MFFRTKKSGTRSYLQIVENRWENGRLTATGRRHAGATRPTPRKSANSTLFWPRVLVLAHSALVLSAHAKGQLPVITTTHIGPALIFDRLWQQTGCQRVIKQLLERRRFEFDVERAVFLTVLHRLFVPGSDRAADKWKSGLPDRGL